MSILLTVEKCFRITGRIGAYTTSQNEEVNLTRRTRLSVVDFGKSCFILIRRLMDAEERIGTEYIVFQYCNFYLFFRFGPSLKEMIRKSNTKNYQLN